VPVGAGVSATVVLDALAVGIVGVVDGGDVAVWVVFDDDPQDATSRTITGSATDSSQHRSHHPKDTRGLNRTRALPLGDAVMATA
jgi:hypothetical protein